MNQWLHSLPALNAALNSVSAVLIVLGYFQIRNKNKRAHKRLMVWATIVSGVFLVSYLIKTWFLGTTPYGGTGAIKVIYLTILFSHLTLAMAIVPLVLITLVQGLSRRFDKHRKIGRWTVPIWLYVSITGVLVFFFLRPWY